MCLIIYSMILIFYSILLIFDYIIFYSILLIFYFILLSVLFQRLWYNNRPETWRQKHLIYQSNISVSPRTLNLLKVKQKSTWLSSSYDWRVTQKPENPPWVRRLNPCRPGNESLEVDRKRGNALVQHPHFHFNFLLSGDDVCSDIQPVASHHDLQCSITVYYCWR